MIFISISLVARASIPTIAEINIPPFKIKFLLYLLRETRSKKRSIKKRVNNICGFKFLKESGFISLIKIARKMQNFKGEPYYIFVKGAAGF